MDIPVFANVWGLFYAAATVVGFGSIVVLIIETLRDWFFKREVKKFRPGQRAFF